MRYAYLILFTDTRNESNSLRIVSERRPTTISAVYTTVLASAKGETFSDARSNLLTSLRANLAKLTDDVGLAAVLNGDDLDKFIAERTEKNPDFPKLVDDAEKRRNEG